jgi:hypothetical protein
MGRPKTTTSRRTIGLPEAILDQLDFTHEWLFVK